MRSKSKAVLLFSFFVLVLTPINALSEISSIVIKGNKRIESDTIKKTIRLAPGDLLTPKAVRNDIEAIYKMGYFENVIAEVEEAADDKQVLAFTVTERPFITSISFDGNDRITTEDLQEEITLKEKSFLDIREVEQNKLKIIKLYQDKGYHNAKVYPIIDKRKDVKKPGINKKTAPPPGETTKIDSELISITFFIQEGEKSHIKDIRLEGNSRVTDKVIFDLIETSPKHWFKSIFTDAGIYKKQQLNNDIEHIKSYYLNRGFLQISVADPEVKLSRDKKWFHIILHISEGDQFRVGKLAFTGITEFSEDDLLKSLKTRSGELVNRELIQQDISSITEKYGNMGYLFTNVTPLFDPDEDEKTADITFDVTEDSIAYVREIRISGNDKTRDKVIRREMRVNEHELINTKNLKRSYQRINNLNFFESVEMIPRRVDGNKVDINIKVKEKSTGTFSIGGGYSSLDRAMAITSITEGNLGGRGQLIKLNAETGSKRTTYSLTFREPYILDYPVSGSFNVFNEDRIFDSYTEKRLGGGIGLSKAFSEYLRGSVSYSRERAVIQDVNEFRATDIVLAQEKRGKVSTASLGISLIMDKRDNPFDPHSGYKWVYSIELAKEFLGGESRFFKGSADYSKFFSIWFNNIFSLHMNIGKVWDIGGADIPVSERFYVGGINSVRGFDFGWAGPIERDRNEIKGGDKKLIFNIEYIIPLLKENNFQWVFFHDAGKGFDNGESIRLNKLKLSAGTGIRFITPIGAIRLEWARIINKKKEDREQLIEFTIGSIF